MGICYSSFGGKNREREWKSENDNTSRLDSKLGKTTSGSGDFASFISKFGGGGGGAAAAAAEERSLHQIPGRLFANGASRVACLYTQQGKKGTNQDAMIVWENFCSRSDTIFCGVFDGHGPYGHMVARKVRDCLPLLLRTEWESRSSDDQSFGCENENGNASESKHFGEAGGDDCCESTENESNVKFPDIYLHLKRSFLKTFKLMDKELKLHTAIDCFCSGTTAVTVVLKGQDLIVGNVGDSRAVLATRDKDNSLMAVQLTVDLKPNLPREAARIQQYKGRVFALQDEPEVARVWLPNSDSPGLAMARAFGDFCLKDFGLISVPDVYYRQITERDEFIVLATDGVWDVLSNKEAVDIVASAPGRSTAARALVDCATRAWRLKYPTSKNDDCAVVCLFVDNVAPVEVVQAQSNFNKAPEEDEVITTTNADSKLPDATDGLASHTCAVEDSNVIGESCEIEPIVESTQEKHPEKGIGQSKRSLAECLSTADDEEWSALEGITRVNSLLSLPRFLSMDKRSGSWRKWL